MVLAPWMPRLASLQGSVWGFRALSSAQAALAQTPLGLFVCMFNHGTQSDNDSTGSLKTRQRT